MLLAKPAPRRSHATGRRHQKDKFLWGAIVATASAAGILTVYAASVGLDALLIALTVVTVLIIRRRFSPTLLSPVQLVPAAFLLLALLGATIYPSVADAPNAAGILLHPSADVNAATIHLLVVVTAAFVAGTVVVAL